MIFVSLSKVKGKYVSTFYCSNLARDPIPCKILSLGNYIASKEWLIMIMVGKCDPSLNGDFCNVSLSRLLWFTGLFSVMTIKDDNQNEIDMTQ